jgi:hypothetical protein
MIKHANKIESELCEFIGILFILLKKIMCILKNIKISRYFSSELGYAELPYFKTYHGVTSYNVVFATEIAAACAVAGYVIQLYRCTCTSCSSGC